jgi:hypothetical protein
MTYYSEWYNVRQDVPQGSVLDPLLFLLYINDLPDTVNGISSPTLFADDKNLICTQENLYKLNDELELVFQKINRWLQTNLLTLNFNKTNFIQFSTKHIETTEAHMKYVGTYQYIQNTNKTNFIVDNSLSWQSHLHKFSSTLNSASYTIGTLKPIHTIENLKVIYYSHAHSIISYGFILGGNCSPSNNS